MLQISNVYAVRMAGVFIISLGTIGMRTRLMPRWLVLVSYLLALVLLLVISVNLWVTLVFPAWVLALSAFLLAEDGRRAPAYPGTPLVILGSPFLQAQRHGVAEGRWRPAWVTVSWFGGWRWPWQQSTCWASSV